VKQKKPSSKKPKVAKAVKAPMPKDITPMAMTLGQQPFNHKDWLYELKWDGYRVISYCSGKNVELKSKGNNNFNRRFSVIKTELEKMNLNAVLDGEIVCLDANGRANFTELITGRNRGLLVYYVFDIIWFNGYDLQEVPLYERRKILKSILTKSDVIRFSDHIVEKGTELFELAKSHRIEGIVGKHKDSSYQPGIRTKQWLKIKTAQIVPAVVAGYIIDKDKSTFSSLIIGKKMQQKYKYIGLVQAGVGPKTIEKILTHGKKTNKSIFAKIPKVNRKGIFREPIKNPEIVWLRPDFTCEVKFLELDFAGEMRHASFKGLI
jgi:bifunctional non-homologous end joining protein LigD